MASSKIPMMTLEHASLARPGCEPLFRNLSWTIRDGETWAIVGPVGSGKSSLAEALQGRFHLLEGTMSWPFIDRLRQQGRTIDWPAQVIHRVSFKEESRLFSYGRHYYQQRFNFIEPEDDLNLDTFLRSGTHSDEAAIHALTITLGIDQLRHLSLIKLSNGQTRRARIARALLAQPEFLILDEPFMGLDAQGRDDIAELLGQLVEKGTRLLLITRRETLPAWVTNVLDLGAIVPAVVPETSPSVPVPRSIDSPPMRGEPIIEMRHVQVGYEGKPILQDLNWTVRQGERWALVGPNGSGKSTLLSLIAGDHPQAYSNEIRLFGQQRGSGESIWDIKQRIGFVSPELHLYFSEPLTAFQTAATGFFDVLAFRPTTRAQQRIVHELFDHFGLSTLAERSFSRLSTGEQRLVLLTRALVKAPPLLILDEPFQGLDTRLINRLRHWLDERLQPDQTLIFVSHHAEEIPRTITHRLRLEAGRVVENSEFRPDQSTPTGHGRELPEKIG